MAQRLFTSLVFLLLLAIPATAATQTFIEGDCEEGTYEKWWMVIEKDGAGNTICTTERNCYGELTSDCPDDTEEPGDEKYIGQVSLTSTDPFFYHGSGDTLWVVEERLTNGYVVCRVWAMSDHVVHTTCNPIPSVAPYNSAPSTPEFRLDAPRNDRIDPKANELPELSSQDKNKDASGTSATVTRTVATEPRIRK